MTEAPTELRKWLVRLELTIFYLLRIIRGWITSVFTNFFPEDIKNWSKQFPEKLGIVLLRLMFAIMWLSQGLVKVINRSDDMYLDNDEFLSQLNYMRETHPNSFVESILEKTDQR